MNFQLFVYLTSSFVLATVVGTLTHECGHYLMATALGHPASVHYSYTALAQAGNNETTLTDELLIRIAGPLENMLVGTIGLLVVVGNRKNNYRQDTLKFSQWLMVFIALFWLRQPANLFVWMGSAMLKGVYSANGDEVVIADLLNLPFWSVVAVTGIIGLLILAYITFRIVPRKERSVFIFSGLTGGVLGYLIWLEWLGKYILP